MVEPLLSAQMNTNDKQRMVSVHDAAGNEQNDEEQALRSSDMAADLRAVNPGLPSVDRRFYFPETWIWTTQHIG